MKGISALISTVLIALITISVISLFSSWAPELVRDATDSTSNQTRHQINCNEASLEIISAEYWSGDGETTIVVRNTGNMELNGMRLEAWDDNSPINSTDASGMEPADLVTENVSSNREPTSVEVISTQCSNAQDVFEDIQ